MQITVTSTSSVAQGLMGDVLTPGQVKTFDVVDEHYLAELQAAESANRVRCVPSALAASFDSVELGSGFMMTAEATGTGAPQDVSHLMGKVPGTVIPVPTVVPAGGFTYTMGTIASDKVTITATNASKFRLMLIP